MRAFVVLSVIVALASAQYNYNAGPIGIPGLPQFQAQQPAAGYIPPASGSGISHAGPGFAPAGNGGFGGAPLATAPNFNYQAPQEYDQPQQLQAPLISKQFYLHSAPEDTDGIGKTKHFVLGRPQKNYRVVFIKAPQGTNGNVRLSAEYAPQEEKTVIYVLSKKDNELDVNDIATPAPTQPSKPEVFFIKYKTPEEAAHAQHEIQKQYDILGGASQFTDEGNAPISSVIGSLTKPDYARNHALNHLGNEYLPSGYNKK